MMRMIRHKRAQKAPNHPFVLFVPGGKKSFSVAIALLALISLQPPLAGQTRRQQSRPTTSPIVLTSVKNEKMAAAFHSGQLPEAMRKPDGKPDEVAAALAKRIAAGDDQSVPALLTALMTAGFGIRDTDGGVTQTVQPGQGLVFEAWEVAAMAKMYGERRTVAISYLCDTIRSVPELKEAPLEKILIDGIRKQAVSDQPELRFWARFIVELGRVSEQPYDLLAAGDNKAVRIDTIQHALILRRMLGDLYTLGQRSEQALKRNHAHAPQTQPCTLSDMESTVADARATALTTAFGELMSWTKEKIEGTAGKLFENYGKLANVLNILLAYAKFIATYAALETEITVDNPPLVRNTSTSAGERRQLTAKVKMNVGKWQQVNCFRWLLNAGTGLDFNLLNDGPLEGVEVNWHLVEGGAADFYSSGDRSEQIVWFVGTGPRIQDAGTYAGIPGKPGTRVTNLASTKTDAQGNARVLLEGSSRRNYIPAPHIPVMKTAVVMTTVKLKGGDIKGDAVDIAGHVLGGVISLGKKNVGEGAAGGMFTLPLELLYRTDWASTATVEVPVKDWETCNGGWYGTVSYSEEWEGKPQGLQKVSKRSHHETIEVKGDSSIAQGDVTTTDIYEGRANVANACLMFRRHFGSGNARREAQVRVLLDGAGGYTLFVNAPIIDVVTKYEISACGHGGREDQFGSETSRSFGVAVNGVQGKLDPAKPGEISGSADISDSIKITWNLKRCQ